MRQPLPCPVCAALVVDDRAHVEQHVTWHEQTKTLGPKGGSYATADGLRLGFRTMRDAVALVDDERPTAKLPPIRETVLRRPPAPEVRELKGRALLLALADAIADDEDLDDDDRRAWPPCAAGVVGGRLCRWPEQGHPCLGYGTERCGMKAQEK